LRTVTVTDGTANGTHSLDVWAAPPDGQSCAQHAWGTPVLNFLKTHDCALSGRRLVTTTLDGHRVAISLQTADVPSPGNAADPYQAAGQFTTLLKGSNTGSINDMLQDGYRFAGGPSKIPANELFWIASQDNGVFIFDAWYLDGTAPNTALQDLCEALVLQQI